MQDILLESHFRFAPLLFRGKVRDVYDLGDALLLVATDRLSAFDHILPTPIPRKGIILTQLSRFWFHKTSALAENHLFDRPLASLGADTADLDVLEGRAVIVKKAQALPVEMIVRGYLAGSAYQEYKQQGSVCGITLPAGLRESQQLETPLFTPSTKAPRGQHDENISFETVEKQIGKKLAQAARSLCLALYTAAAKHAASRGIIIADTKIELGLYQDRLIVIDELLTPDSSRFWPAESYTVGASPPSYDKQFVRDYLLSSGWDRNSPPPSLPDEIVAKTAARYQKAYEVLKAD